MTLPFDVAAYLGTTLRTAASGLGWTERGFEPEVRVADPAHGDFQFGSIVNRSPLVVAISTDGAAPVFGQAIRARIETLLPMGFQAWAAAAVMIGAITLTSCARQASFTRSELRISVLIRPPTSSASSKL